MSAFAHVKIIVVFFFISSNVSSIEASVSISSALVASSSIKILDFLSNNNLKVKSDDLIIRNQIKSIGEHTIEINPYEDISEEFLIIVGKN